MTVQIFKLQSGEYVVATRVPSDFVGATTKVTNAFLIDSKQLDCRMTNLKFIPFLPFAKGPFAGDVIEINTSQIVASAEVNKNLLKQYTNAF